MKLKPTIVLISGKHPLTAKSGYALYAKALARELTALSYDVYIFCVSNRDAVARSKIGTIHMVKIPLIRLVAGREMVALLPASIFLYRSIMRWTKRNQSVVLWGIGPWSLAGAWVKKSSVWIPFFADYFTTLRHEYRLLLPTLETFMANLVLIPLYALCERYALTTSDKIITHYRSTEQILAKEFGIHATKFRQIPYAVDTLFRRSQKDRNRIPMLLTVCRQDFRKDIPDLLHAYAMLNDRRIPFRAVIVGGGRLLSHHRLLARALHLTNVMFTGSVNTLKPFIERAYCFVLPTLEEGSGSIAILEAMAAGLPIVATDIDGIPEDVKDGVSGYLVPPGNPHAMAGAIERMLYHPNLHRRLGSNARIAYREKFSKKIIRSSLQRLLTSVMK